MGLYKKSAQDAM